MVAPLLVVGAMLLLAVGSAQATLGALDTSFGSGGTVTTSIGSGYDVASALALQPDGKLVVAGNTYNGSNTDFALARYDASGALDTSFGTGGKVTTPIGSADDKAKALVLQPDGKLVVAGSSYVSNNDFALARYNANGTLDTSFGTGGTVTTPISGPSAVSALVLQPDGKLVVAGSSYSGNYNFALARYNANGTLDTSFGTGGKVTTPVGSAAAIAFALALQPDGKLVAAGYGWDGTKYDFALVRYNADGTLDNTFGPGGKVLTAIGSSTEEAKALVLQPDGKLVAFGESYNNGNDDFALVRYNANGTPDASFGAGGKVLTPVGNAYDYASALALLPDGKLVAGGYSTVLGWYNFSLVRYDADGTPDSGFGSGGKITTAVGPGNAVLLALALQPDGKLVAAGNSNNGTDADFALVRYQGATLAVTKAGTGAGTVTSSPAGIACGSSCSSPFTAVPVTLSASAAAGSTFAGWSGACSGTGTCQVTMDSDKSVSATFNKASELLSVSKSGSTGAGTVTSTPSGINCASTCSHRYDYGTSVTLTATHAAGSGFKGWSGACSGTGKCTLSMTSNKSVTAVFLKDGVGTMKSSLTSVVHGSTGKTVAFTYTAATGGMLKGQVTLTVPSGWSAPSLTGTSRGFVKASIGTLSISNRTIVVSNLTRAAGQTLLVTYGSKAAGGLGATAPASVVTQTWLTTERSTLGGILSSIALSPKISVT
jgi:uncharacterized delta-60 repeat protein